MKASALPTKSNVSCFKRVCKSRLRGISNHPLRVSMIYVHSVKFEDNILWWLSSYVVRPCGTHHTKCGNTKERLEVSLADQQHQSRDIRSQTRIIRVSSAFERCNDKWVLITEEKLKKPFWPLQALIMFCSKRKQPVILRMIGR